ncbi:baseplate J/gp47 family protein [Thiomicrorhabdus sp.]|uniref:baseplate J/gp47 family protein n=1 Tax=Thiomicrorhabdus sp. TaxID=2039724 RepID=UPI00356A8B8E
MSQKPSLQQLIDRAKTSMINKLGVSTPAIDALAAAIGGGNYGQYSYQDYLFRQLNPETADEEWLYLWASRLGVDRILPSYATGSINFFNTSGVVSVPEGTIVKTADDKQYQVSQVTNSDQPVPVVALTAGSNYNLSPGVNLYLVSSVLGLNPDTITTDAIAGGSEIEDLEHWRNRIIVAFQSQQAIGRREDYKNWAISAHSDVDFGWALDNTPATGNVTVYIGQRENNPIVTDTVKTAVQDYIETKRLAGCHAFINHPITKPLNITISDVADLTTRNTIASALQTYINGRLGDQQAITPGEIILVVSAITTNFSLISPIASVSPATDEVITLGAITWQ